MKLFKKVASVALASVLAGSMLLAGCGDSGSSEAASASKAESTAAASSTKEESSAPATEAAGDLSGKKIGMTVLVNDGLFATMVNYLTQLTDACGVEFVLDVGAFSPEDQVASVENLVAAGCDGILYCNFGETVLPKVAQICDEAEVYWVQYCREIADPEVLEALNSSKYYVGRTVEDNYSVGVNIAKEFSELGKTKTAIIGPTPGDSTTDTEDQGYKATAEELGLEIYTEVRNCEEAADCTKAVETILSSFPDTEAICVLSGSTGKLEGVFKGLENMGKLGQIAVGALDASDNIGADFEAGSIQIAHLGQYVDPGFSLAILLNAVAGTPLSEDKIVIEDQYVVFRSADDAENYAKYVENNDDGIYAFTGEEFKQFIKVFNPDASVETIQAAASAYSVDDVIARHNG